MYAFPHQPHLRGITSLAPTPKAASSSSQLKRAADLIEEEALASFLGFAYFGVGMRESSHSQPSGRLVQSRDALT